MGVASGWRDLLEEMDRQSVAASPDVAALWHHFEEAAAASPRTTAMGLARQLGTKLSPAHRAVLAVVVGMLLEPIEWPAEWEQARQALVSALDELAQQVDPTASDSLPAALRIEEDMLLLSSRNAFLVAQDLLHRPCPVDDIVPVAALCRTGTAGCFFAFARTLASLPPEADRGAVQLARTRYEVAFQKYAQAARAMNAACGAVLFDGLDLRLEGA